MAELKTKPNDQDVNQFIESIQEADKREACQVLVQLMQEVTGEPPKMWGDSMVGFGTYHYKYASGREGDWFITGFSPRKQNLTIYFLEGFEQHQALLERLGKHKVSKSCLYVNRLSDIDLGVLRELVRASYAVMAKK